MAHPFRVIEGGKGRPIYIPKPRNRLPIWQWLTQVGPLLALVGRAPVGARLGWVICGL